MFTRLSNGFALVGSSWRVLKRDKHLLWFPVVSGILYLLILASFLIPLVTLVDWAKIEHDGGKPPVWTYAVAFAFYFCTYFVAIFCNSALLCCTFLRYNGQNPTVGDGFRGAMARLPQIFAWALVSATVGLLLKLVEQAHEKAGQIVASVLGTAWSIMTYFVVPVMVVERVGPFEAVGRSVKLLTKTWGEAATGQIGLGLVLFLVAIPIILLLVAGGYLLSTGATALGVTVLVAGLIVLLLYLAVSAALHTILVGAIYQYAADGRVPEGFDESVMAGAFTSKATA